jgi:hypothetical protein
MPSKVCPGSGRSSLRGIETPLAMCLTGRDSRYARHTGSGMAAVLVPLLAVERVRAPAPWPVGSTWLGPGQRRTEVDPKACRPRKASASAVRAVIDAPDDPHASGRHQRAHDVLERRPRERSPEVLDRHGVFDLEQT